MSAWFVDDPLWAYVVCGFVALVLLVMFFTSKRVKFVVWIAVPLFIALGFYLLDRYVETDREQVVRKTHELAAAAQRGDIAALDALISPKFSIEGYVNKDLVLGGARAFLPANQERRVAFSEVDAELMPTTKSYRVTCNLSASGQFGPQPVPQFFGVTTFTFIKDDDGQWRMSKFEVKTTQGEPIRPPPR